MPKDNLNSIKWQKFGRYVLGFLAITAILVWLAIIQKPDGNIHVYFLDIGQGDSIYIRTDDEYDILIDGGPNNKVLSELGEVMPFWDHKIDLVIATHPDLDHIGGLVEVLNRYQIGKVLMTDVSHTTDRYQELLDVIGKRNIPVQLAVAGDELKISNKCKAKIFWPKDSYKDIDVKNLNDTSIVNNLVCGDVTFLFTGDSEELTQQQLVELYKDELKSDVLKISHHGSRNASEQGFLEAVNPELAIISAGKNNRYGHPHKEVLDKLNQLYIKYFRTDEFGRIEVISDGKYFWVKN